MKMNEDGEEKEHIADPSNCKAVAVSLSREAFCARDCEVGTVTDTGSAGSARCDMRILLSLQAVDGLQSGGRAFFF